MNYNLAGKVAIVTGAGSGIGKQTALQLASEGVKVIVNARNGDRLHDVQEEIKKEKGTCEIFQGDVSQQGFSKDLMEFTVSSFGKVDILVCSAGMALRTPSLEMDEDEWNHVMQVNLTAPFILSQCFIRQLLTQGDGGKIIYVSSTAGKSVNMGASPSYGASKAGLLYLTRHFATEFAKSKIYVNAVCPGPVDTKITSSWSREHREKVMSFLPLGRIGSAEEVANAILFLSSELSDYITGESILINGGRFME